MGAVAAEGDFQARRRLTGSRLGQYLIGPRLGAGGTASVYLARLAGPHGFERLVALKVVHDHLSEETEFITQFLDEANLLVRLDHPNIVRVHELGRAGETLYLAIEYLDGQPLSALIDKLQRERRRLPPELVAWLGARVADGLAYAHALKDAQGAPEGLVHRDISPQNVFITYDGSVKVIDFGIARARGRLSRTTVGRIKGKFSYMAPEQALGSGFDHRADLFALGASLHEAAAAARLFKGEDETDTLQKLLIDDIPDLTSTLTDFPAELASTLSRCLERDPNARHPTAAALATELDAFVAKHAPGRDLRGELASLLGSLFAQEREKQLAGIEELKALEAQPDTLRPTPSLDDRPSRVGLRAHRPRWALGLALGLAVALAVVSLILLGRAQPAPAQSEPPPAAPSLATIEVVVEPAEGAQVLIDGRRASGSPPRLALPQASHPVRVEVSAAGKQRVSLAVVPDRDRSMLVTLVDEPAAVPTAGAPAASAPKPGKGKSAPAGQKSGKTGGSPGSLVTEYPF
ncbi:MAG: protein kinase [Polyangiaceae bacterium]|nr:protein kinase [Polyangiaceae bacterium]